LTPEGGRRDSAPPAWRAGHPERGASRGRPSHPQPRRSFPKGRHHSEFPLAARFAPSPPLPPGPMSLYACQPRPVNGYCRIERGRPHRHRTLTLFQGLQRDLDLCGLPQPVAQLQDRPGSAEADRSRLHSDQLAQGVGGLSHAIGHLTQRPPDHLSPQLGDTMTGGGVGQTTGRSALAEAGVAGSVPDGLSAGQGQEQGVIAFSSAILGYCRPSRLIRSCPWRCEVSARGCRLTPLFAAKQRPPVCCTFRPPFTGFPGFWRECYAESRGSSGECGLNQTGAKNLTTSRSAIGAAFGYPARFVAKL
jgi:hypothetical protein